MRRKHLAALAVFAIVIVTWGCKHANAEVQDTDSGTATGKTLVVYFSHQVPYEVDGVTGASYAPVDTGYASSTEYFATYIQKQTGRIYSALPLWKDIIQQLTNHWPRLRNRNMTIMYCPN